MRLQKTTVESASTTSPKTSPSSIVPITYNSSPNNDGNWTTKTFFTCPSSALYAKIYFKSSIASGGTYNYMTGSSSGHFGVKFGGSVIFEGHNQGTYGSFYINAYNSNTTLSSFHGIRLEDNDAIFSNYYTGIIVSGSRLILNPGEKFELISSSGSHTGTAYLDAEAHVFNAV